ncbi:MAG: exopolyphosphatase, partial [Duodenibacillus sp.]|nr:exopolyphosphatase [Duodenibacillus sp.]
RTGIDKQQASRVAGFAGGVYQLLQGGRPDSRARERLRLLQWAAAVHEAGRLISPSGYHRHTQYILEQCDLPGFSRTQQRILGLLALAQRGGLAKVAEGVADDALRPMILALRLAVIFAHRRKGSALPALALTASGKNFALTLPGLWCDRHPLEMFLLDNEALAWSEAGCGLDVRLSPAGHGRRRASEEG